MHCVYSGLWGVGTAAIRLSRRAICHAAVCHTNRCVHLHAPATSKTITCIIQYFIQVFISIIYVIGPSSPPFLLLRIFRVMR